MDGWSVIQCSGKDLVESSFINTSSFISIFSDSVLEIYNPFSLGLRYSVNLLSRLHHLPMRRLCSCLSCRVKREIRIFWVNFFCLSWKSAILLPSVHASWRYEKVYWLLPVIFFFTDLLTNYLHFPLMNDFFVLFWYPQKILYIKTNSLSKRSLSNSSNTRSKNSIVFV